MTGPSRRNRRRRRVAETNTVVTNRSDCCAAAETIAEELYAGNLPEILMRSCCDPLRGCNQVDARARCNFWPSFAHPRWLSCRELHNRQISE